MEGNTVYQKESGGNKGGGGHGRGFNNGGGEKSEAYKGGAGRGFDKGGAGRGFDKGGAGRGFEKGGAGRGFDKGGAGRGYDKGGAGRGFDNSGGGGFDKGGDGRGYNKGGYRNTQNEGDNYHNRETRNSNKGRQNAHENQQPDLDKKHRMQGEWKSTSRENFIPKSRKSFSPATLGGAPDSGVMQHLQECYIRRRPVPTTTLDQVIANSFNFWEQFPTETSRLHSIVKSDLSSAQQLEKFLHSVYPIVHHSTLRLMIDFLNHKKKYGTNTERSLYGGMDLIAFVERLIKQRPMSFLGANDQYYLPPPSYKHGYGGFEDIGTDREKFPLILENLLSYDEMRISALISLSSWSVFVNDGKRKNYGVLDKRGSYQQTGVICGQVGCRLKKEGVMEYLDCVVTRNENVEEKGFGSENLSHVNSVWSKMWGNNLPTHYQANVEFNKQRDGTAQPGSTTQFEYVPLGKDLLFNVTVYKKRIFLTAEILLCEAASRAEEAGKQAYIHVVGLGLGVWKASNKQEEWFVEAWGDALRSASNTKAIAHVDFSYIDCFEVHGIKNGEKFPNTDITIHFSKRNLHSLVPDDCILVCNYAWDGNSLPGNEYWLEKVCSTGDSAAACSSSVGEIHNHIINPVVCGDAMRVATSDGRAVFWEHFAKGVTGQEQTENATAFLKPTISNISEQPFDSNQTEQYSTPASKWDRPVETVPESFQPSKCDLPQVVAPDPTHSTLGPNEAVAIEVMASPKEPEIPAQIPHPTIPGLVIDNPAYKKNKSAGKKNKVKKSTSENTVTESRPANNSSKNKANDKSPAGKGNKNKKKKK